MWLQHEWMKKKLNGFFLYIEVRTWLEKKIGVPKQKIKIKFIYWINKNWELVY
jgi:hypothetical protein